MRISIIARDMTNLERPARLNRDDVLRAALDLLNEIGIDALTTRKLAERLGYDLS